MKLLRFELAGARIGAVTDDGVVDLTGAGSPRRTVREIAAAERIAYRSTAFTLETGDLIATGTPEGVGVAMKPQAFLKSGDVVLCEIEQIGYVESKVGMRAE